MNSMQPFCFVYLIFQFLIMFHLFSNYINADVLISNDSPTLIGTPIIFSVSNIQRVSWPLYYRIHFTDDLNIVDTFVDTHGSVNTQFVYDGKLDPNHVYQMKVTVEMWYILFPLWLIPGQQVSTFTLTNDIQGTIELNQTFVPSKALEKSLISSGNPILFEFKLKDPTNALINLEYQWLIDNSRYDNYTGTTFEHHFKKSKNHTISTIVSAVIAANNVTHQGTITRNVTVLDPITKIDNTGAKSIVSEENLKLFFEIQGGSPNFWFCYAILPNNKSALICENEIKLKNRTFFLEKYFRESGTFYLRYRGGNDISMMEDNIQIDVQEIIKQPQLSVIIIPIVCSILAITIVVFGIAYHLNHRHNFIIETADFDFQKHNMDELMEKTFFERMKDTFINSVQTFFLCGFFAFRWTRLEERVDETNPNMSDSSDINPNVTYQSEVQEAANFEPSTFLSTNNQDVH